MEKRIITIVSTANSNKVELETDAATLGELKAAMRQANIAYEGMTFYEGLTKSELVDDASLLPHDVVRNGQTTNNLVFMLTNTNKKIRSGYDRLELYNIIKEKGLAEECKKKFGKNFTMCKTSELEDLVNSCCGASKNGQPAPKKPTAQKEEKQETANNSTQQELTALSMGFNKLLEILEDNDVIDEDDVEEIKSRMIVREGNEKALYKNEEINDMFSFLKR
jgi:hypothetical protein